MSEIGLIVLAALFGAWVGLLIGIQRGRHVEAWLWRGCSILPEDHMRSAGNDYKVMLLDAFYRDYHNPLARAKMKADAPLSGLGKAVREARGGDALPPDKQGFA